MLANFHKPSLKNIISFDMTKLWEKIISPLNNEVFELTYKQIKESLILMQMQHYIQSRFWWHWNFNLPKDCLFKHFSVKLSIKRHDLYGIDTFENRSRLCIEVVESIRNVIDIYAPEGFIFGFRATPEETYGPN